jgi:IS30 family transposase
LVDSKLKETWSPQQISGYLLVNKQPGVSHESIYQRIYADKRKGGTLHLTLRCQKIRKKRYTGRARRGSIPNQVSIDLRPVIVAERARFGDWEADLVIGAGQKKALVTINEHSSRYSLIAHVPFKTAELVTEAMIAKLKPFTKCGHTLQRITVVSSPSMSASLPRLMRTSTLPILIPLGSAAPTKT